MLRLLVSLTAAALLAGCTLFSGRGVEPKGGATLAAGLRQYEEGNYVESSRMLQSAIEQGLAERDKVNAHKHLAFMHCAAGRERVCREEFRKALAIDPRMDLAPAEAGHPVWGPVFRSLKAAR